LTDERQQIIRIYRIILLYLGDKAWRVIMNEISAGR